MHLSADPEHGFAEYQFENDTYIRCPLGCEGVWDKRVDDFRAFVIHMDEHDD